jgi:hypothetical protein
MVVEPEAEFSATLAFFYNPTCSSSRTARLKSIQQQQQQQQQCQRAGEKLLYELVNAADSVVSARTIELNDDAAADIEMLQLRPFSNRRETRIFLTMIDCAEPQHQNIRGATKAKKHGDKEEENSRENP